MEQQKTIWTHNQSLAINISGASVAVSAAAGSGKTSVMTERIAKEVTKENGIDISRTVCVTFTRAAAETLRRKLYGKISEKAVKNPKDKRIAEALVKLNDATICTTDSFFKSIVDRFYYTIGLESAPEVGDKSEIDRLISETSNEVIGIFTKKSLENPMPDFDLLYAFLSETRSDRNVVLFIEKLYNKLLSYPEKEEVLAASLEKTKEEYALLKQGKISFDDTLFGKNINKSLGLCIEEFILKFEYLSEITKNTEIDAYYGEMFSDFIREGKEWLHLADLGKTGEIKNSSDMIRNKRLPTTRGISEQFRDLKESVQSLAKETKDSVSKWFEENAGFGEDELINQMENLVMFQKISYELIKEFDRIFSEKKRRLGICDYSDIEHFAFKILIEKKGSEFVKTPVAEKISNETDAVFVDEYQDTNNLQHLIFGAVSKGNNLFMVGDPKQCIYQFRNANPEIFTNLRNRFPRYGTKISKEYSVVLSDNFRCDKPIIDFTNYIFSFIMDSEKPFTLYGEEDRLVHSKKNAFNDGKYKPEIVFTEEENEAAYIADRILSLMNEVKKDDGTCISYSDIAVISRKSKALVPLTKELEKRNIPSTDVFNEEIKVSEEYLFIDSLLGAVFDPLEDISLLGTLSSPVFRFDSDELFYIRRFGGKGSFYSCIEKVSRENTPVSDKAKEFLETLSFLRNKMKYLSMTESIWLIYRHLSVEEIYSSIDSNKEKTLSLILEAAKKFDTSLISGIMKFRVFLAENLSQDVTSEIEDSVKLYTIHKSKGLEFPVVFIMGADDEYTSNETREKWDFSEKAGIVFDYAMDDGEVGLKTPIRKSVNLEREKNQKEEEKRILYVALTRAVKKLVITSSKKHIKKLFEKSFMFSDVPVSRKLRMRLIENAKSPIELIFAALQGIGDLKNSLYFGGSFENEFLMVTNAVSDESNPIISDKYETSTENVLTDLNIIDKIKESISFEYPDISEIKIPEKLSVSEIVETNESDGDINLDSLYDFSAGKLCTSYSFIGTAMHKTMQFMSFEEAEKDIEKEVLRMKEKKFITSGEYDVLDIEKLANFFKSDIYAEIKKSKKVVREKRFNVLFDAEKIFPSKGKVLVQGVIDIYFENPDKTITVLDFKTDRVKGESAEETLKLRHSKQLALYSEAIEKITGLKVTKKIIYSFALDKCIETE